MSKKIIIVFKSMSEPCLKASPLVWLSSFYVHFILPRTKAQSDIFLYKEPLHYDHLVVQTARFIVARCTVSDLPFTFITFLNKDIQSKSISVSFLGILEQI